MRILPAGDKTQRRPLYRAEYEALGRLGMFDDEKVELLDGQIVYAAGGVSEYWIRRVVHADARRAAARMARTARPASPSRWRNLDS
ncbi:MAG: hypothetical protein ACR2KP_19335, partial [Egibacteraceae bacterium]